MGTATIYALNDVGKGWISKTSFTKLALREGHDVLNIPFVGLEHQHNQITFRSSEYYSTKYDPVLEVSYTTGPPPITYGYDPQGQRIQYSNGKTTTYYPTKFYNTAFLTSNLQSPTSIIKHIFADSLNIATIEGSGTNATAHYTITDNLGGSSLVTSQAGTQEELMDYYPFGAIRIDQKTGTGTTAFSEQRKYIGQEYDPDTGLNYLNARYYNSNIGRFISQDSVFLAIGDNAKIKELTGQELQQILQDPQNLNSYAYSRNNPITLSDPDGKFLETVLDVVSIGYDLYDLGHTVFTGGSIKDISKSAGYLAFDVGATFIPFIPAVGLISRVEKVAEAGKAAASILKSLQKPAEALAQREKLLNLAQHPEAKKVIEQVFQETDKYLGGTAGALKIEKQLGIKIGSEAGHAIKAEQRINNINKTFRDYGKEFNKSTTKVLNDVKKGLERTLKMQ